MYTKEYICASNPRSSCAFLAFVVNFSVYIFDFLD
jgi:hypothetical protein